MDGFVSRSTGGSAVRHPQAFVLVAAMLAGMLWASGCGDGATEPPTPTPDPPQPTTVTVGPATTQLTALGATVQLTAEVRDQNGQVMGGASVIWASSTPEVATVSSSGLATAAGNGIATITATAGSASGTATVTVAQEVVAVAVTPAADTLVVGDTLRLAAEATDANGHVVEEAEFAWASSDTLVAVVDDAGLVTGVGAGDAEVTATAAGITGRAELTVVAPAPTTIAVTPDTVALTALGQTAQLTAVVRDQARRVLTEADVSWSSGDTTVAAVDSAGLVTAAGSGTTTITATAGEAADDVLVTVMQSAGSVIVSPSADTVALGDTLRLVAEAFDDNGHVVDGAEFTWSSSDVSVARVDGSGLVRGIAEGTATITADAGDVRGSSAITVGDIDRLALVALYQATDGPNWANNRGWLTDAPLNDWYGVSTDGSGRVARLDLRGPRDSKSGLLSGSIPPELGNLASLERLILIDNDLFGPIPLELGNLANLTVLSLSGNDLSGPIPPELGNLANLQDLSLYRNDLSSSIPPELGNLANLRGLALSGNDLSGPIPPELGNLANLTGLYLDGNSLTGSIPPELGNLANLQGLFLGRNDLTGSIPPEIGNLTNLTRLFVSGNDLSGPIPNSFLQLEQLSHLGLSQLGVFGPPANELLCVPGLSSFSTWLAGMTRHDVEPVNFCNAIDVATLESLFEATGGIRWTRSAGWSGSGAIAEWHGVTVDTIGRVTRLDLTRNGLAGLLPASLGNLSEMTELRIGGNALSGSLPLSLTQLSLQEFLYQDTGLCIPTTESFRAWLNGIPSHEGTSVECEPLSDRDILEILYHATGGPNWYSQDNWLSNAPPREWHGVRVDGQGRVFSLSLGGNSLTGLIPPELGNLANLTGLNLHSANLTGPIPPELGHLVNLRKLSLHNNNLSGPLPPELGNLTNLTSLKIEQNDLSGPIPPDLGNLAHIAHLSLSSNNLTGAIPPEIGGLSTLETLELHSNQLSGPVPPDVSGMASLRTLGLAYNSGMRGALPIELTALRHLDALLTASTGLCAPPDAEFQSWLEGIRKYRVAPCAEGEPPMVYLTQAVQSPEFPVPLVAGEKALLRVFPTARQATSAGIPAVRARFYRDGRETHVANIEGKSTPIPTEVSERSLAKSANAEIPGRIVHPGLEMVIEIDPQGTLDPGLGVVKRIPDAGRLVVDVRAMPLFDLTLIPFIWNKTRDASIVDLTRAMAADPENHEMFADMPLLPIGELVVTAHDPVLSSSNDPFALLKQTAAIRAMEGGTGHYKGMMSLPLAGRFVGVAQLPGRSSFSAPKARTIAHELGHNISLQHAPCGGAGSPDPSYPYSDGSIGRWGYDFADGGRLVHPSTPDLMAYCGRGAISDYHFTNALRFRLSEADGVGLPDPPPVAAAAKSFLLWGGIGADSVPYLEPAIVIDAPAALPDSVGDYRVSGRTAGGGELFSLSFTMPETADGDGSSSFAFILPVRPEWEGNLATITLTGPGGSFTLDGESDRPMAILRNPRTGQVRGILRDLLPPTQAAIDVAGRAAGVGLEVLFSRGIPDAVAWSR